MATPIPDIAFDFEHFTHDKLGRIVPVAQTREIGEAEFTLLAIECYATGFVTTVLLEQDWQVPDPAPPTPEDLETPQVLKGLHLISKVVDDLGNEYVGQARSGGGGGEMNGQLGIHKVYCFAPALDPAASTLTFTLSQVERPRYDSNGRATWSDDQIVGGPWTLEFSLDHPSRDGSAAVSVLPVAAHFGVDDISVTVTTIDRYSWGFVLNSRVDWSTPDGPFPQPIWRAVDDHGGTYRTGNCPGGGNVVGNKGHTWRMHCIFGSAIDPEATELTIQLIRLGIQRPVLSEEEDRFDHWEQLRHEDNLGEITIALPAAT